MDNLNSSQMLPVGTILDSRYRIEKYLASGGFGNTYVAFDTRFDCQVAVKEFFMRGTNHRSADHTTVVVSNVANQEGFDAQLDKFRCEAKRIFDMRNDHIVHVVDLYDTNGTSYYVMDLIEGESLKDRVKQRPLNEAEVRNVASQLLDALGAVHAAGFYHLDVKPGNIMMDKKGHCTLIDFGASKQMSAMDRTSMSASGMAYTPGYAPLEQEMQRMKNIGPWTDFYAVGATLYNLLTGQLPPEVDPDDTADASRMFAYPADVSTVMRRAISCMMNPSPRKRPQNVEQMKAALEGIFAPFSDEVPDAVTVQAPHNDKQSTPPPTLSSASSGVIEASSKRWIWLMGGAVILGLIVLFLFLLNGRDKTDLAENIAPEPINQTIKNREQTGSSLKDEYTQTEEHKANFQNSNKQPMVSSSSETGEQFSQPSISSLPTNLKNNQSSNKTLSGSYRGKIGGNIPIVMTIIQNGTQLSGNYYYKSQGPNNKISFTGYLDDSGRQFFFESRIDDVVSQFSGTVSNFKLEGEYHNLNKDKYMSFSALKK